MIFFQMQWKSHSKDNGMVPKAPRRLLPNPNPKLHAYHTVGQ